MIDLLLLAADAPVHPSSGDFWNPANWSEFIKQIGFPGFFAVLMFTALAYLWIRQLRQPTNRQQVTLLKLMYADSQQRNVRMRQVLGKFCDVVVCILADDSVKARERLDQIRDVLNAQPPLTPVELALDEEDGM